MYIITNIISYIFIFPIITIFILYKSNENISKGIALRGSILTFISSILYILIYDNNTILYQSMIINIIGIDWKNIWLIILTTFLIPITILISWNTIKNNIKLYYIIIIIIELVCIGIFTIIDILYFYILYETILIPIFIMIGIWGIRKEKIKAAYSLFFYTLTGSLLLLLAMIYIYINTLTYHNILLLNLFNFDKFQYIILFICFFISFAVKLPLYPIHLWLPQAHVEAPVAGSVLLAGILLKLGGYGILRYNLSIFPLLSEYLSPIIWIISIIGIIYTSIITIRQIDIKRIIAYSSIAHMSMVCLGLFNNTSILGSYIMMIAHGIVSPGLFIMIGFIYDRLHTRNIKYIRGLTITMPIWSIIMLILILANIGTPPTLNYIGEFIITLNLYYNNKIITILSLTSIVLSAAYSLYLYNRMAFGKVSEYINTGLRDLNRIEFNSIIPIIIVLIWISINVNIIINNVPIV